MPCYEPRDNPTVVRAECASEFRHNSDVAQMLCEVLRHIERVTGPHMPTALKEFSPQLQQWWAEHQERDRLKQLIEIAYGAELDNYGRNVGLFRFTREADVDFRKRILPRYL